MYNVMSKKAEEFIDHEEIEECLAYAEANKNNEACIDAILENEGNHSQRSTGFTGL